MVAVGAIRALEPLPAQLGPGCICVSGSGSDRHRMGTSHRQGPCPPLLPAASSLEVRRMATDRLLYRQTLPTCAACSRLSDLGGI